MDKAAHPTTLGVFKPVGHTVIAFRTAPALEAAYQELKAMGFAGASMVRYSASEMAAQCESDLKTANTLANFGYELDLVRSHGDLAQQGCGFLVVEATTEALASQVATLVHTIRPAAAQHYGSFMIEDLTERPPGRMGETQPRP